MDTLTKINKNKNKILFFSTWWGGGGRGILMGNRGVASLPGPPTPEKPMVQ
jgi:hypothetical protein